MRGNLRFLLSLIAGVGLMPTVALSQMITSFEPTYGKPGTQVVITGPNFSGVSAVRFNGVKAVFHVVASPATQMIAFVPVGATTGPISVTTPLGTVTGTQDFTVIGDEPYIADFFPETGAPGTIIIIEGANFTLATAVMFNGTLAQFQAPTSDTQILAAVPAGVTTGPISVRSPLGVGTSRGNFYAAPLIAGFAPGVGKPGDVITVTGLNFTDSTRVEFNGQASPSFKVLSNTQLSATVPPDAITGPITVFTPIAAVDSWTNFVVAPRISGFSPPTGKPGDLVTVSGANFGGTSAVEFNRTNATFTVVSASQISAQVPQGATTGPLSVTTPAGTATTLTNFFLAPRISGFSPAGGEVGAEVILEGVNFLGATSVKFSSASAAFEVVSPTRIGARVPTNATTGPISVTAPAGTSSTSSNFVVFTTADLVVSQRATPDPVVVGTPLTYTITVTNRGPKRAADVRLTDVLPAGVELVSADSSQGICSQVGSKVVCTLGLLGESPASVTIVVTPLIAGVATNQVTVASSTADSDLSNNESKLKTTVLPVPSPRLALSQAADNVTLSWPMSASNFVLEATGDLRPPVVWTDVVGTPLVVGDRYTLKVGSREGSRFFRLKRP
jgi:uncharacterized repeat protein (TIGR01451 family)